MGHFVSVGPYYRVTTRSILTCARARYRVFGMLCIQVWTYYQRYPNDGKMYKVLVR